METIYYLIATISIKDVSYGIQSKDNHRFLYYMNKSIYLSSIQCRLWRRWDEYIMCIIIRVALIIISTDVEYLLFKNTQLSLLDTKGDEVDLVITLFISTTVLCLTLLCGILFIFSMNDGIFHGIFLVTQNNVMDLNNLMVSFLDRTLFYLLLIGVLIVLIWWESNTWWFSYNIDDIRVKVSFHVGCSPTRFKWNCRCHQVESTFPLESGGQAADKETHP